MKKRMNNTNTPCVPEPTGSQTLSEIAGGFDSEENRLLILNPRHWTLLNGEDSRSREDVRGILGIGEKALVVDNAASCVVAAVNTYQRRYAVQAAQDVLTWKLVAEQVVEGEEHDEVAVRLREARDVLKEKVQKAYRHYAYLVRKGEQLEVVFSRFDDDKQTALNGNDVWSALVLSNRAVGEYFDPTVKARKRKPLSEEYVATLLSAFDRHLTLRDVVSSFYKNPRFPMVSNADNIRDAIYGMLQEPGHAGPGTGGWELIGSDGSSLHVDNAKQIAISSAQQQIRKLQPKAPEHNGDGDGAVDLTTGNRNGSEAEERKPVGVQDAVSTDERGDGTRGSNVGDTSGGVKKHAGSYSWYGIELTNRSITDEAKRDDICKHLRWLISQLENEEIDRQLITLKYDLMAGTDSYLASEIEARGSALQAKVKIRDEEI